VSFLEREQELKRLKMSKERTSTHNTGRQSVVKQGAPQPLTASNRPFIGSDYRCYSSLR